MAWIMKTKQWYWIAKQIKSFLQSWVGRIPDDEMAAETMELYEKIMDITEKSRAKDPGINADIREVFRQLFLIIHSAEKEGKAL